MKILIVINDYVNKGNGLSISTQRFVEGFRKKGHEVRILALEDDKVDYGVPQLKIPFFQKVIDEQGYKFAKPVKEKIEEAVSWADIVHVEDPFFLCYSASKIAKKKNKPLTGTFHIYPQNLTSSVSVFNNKLGNSIIMKLFKNGVYKNCDAIQCPTNKVKDILLNEKFENNLYAISNGIPKEYIATEIEKLDNDRFNILSIGRYSKEKDQETLIKAVSLSKYKDRIQLYLLGKGPLKNEYEKMCENLPNKSIMKFCDSKELKEIIKKSNLYVHCANVEIEGMSCMETFANGCVPLIADAYLSSTVSYAITENNKFEAGNSEDLAKKIDCFIENPELIEKLRKDYIELANKLTLEKTTDQVLGMMEEVLKKGV